MQVFTPPDSLSRDEVINIVKLHSQYDPLDKITFVCQGTKDKTRYAVGFQSGWNIRIDDGGDTIGEVYRMLE